MYKYNVTMIFAVANFQKLVLAVLGILERTVASEEHYYCESFCVLVFSALGDIHENKIMKRKKCGKNHKVCLH